MPALFAAIIDEPARRLAKAGARDLQLIVALALRETPEQTRGPGQSQAGRFISVDVAQANQSSGLALP